MADELLGKPAFVKSWLAKPFQTLPLTASEAPWIWLISEFPYTFAVPVAASHHLIPGHSTYTESGSAPAASFNVQSPRKIARLKLPPEVELPLNKLLMFVLSDDNVAPGALVFNFEAIDPRMSLYVAMLAV